MKRAVLTLVALAAAGICGGCKVGHGLYKGLPAHGTACQDGCCQPGCEHGACSTCPPELCVHGGAPTDGHPDPYEPFHFGHQGPPQRGGVLSFLGRIHGGPPHGAQPAPPPSPAGVSYPYYTTRGPRDFLASDPRGIGP